MAKETDEVIAIKGKHGSLRVTIQQLLLLLGACGLTVGGSKLMEGSAPAAVQEVKVEAAPAFIELRGSFVAHDAQQKIADGKQERVDDGQTKTVEMLNQGINDGFRAVEGRLAGVEAKLQMLLDLQPRQGSKTP